MVGTDETEDLMRTLSRPLSDSGIVDQAAAKDAGGPVSILLKQCGLWMPGIGMESKTCAENWKGAKAFGVCGGFKHFCFSISPDSNFTSDS